MVYLWPRIDTDEHGYPPSAVLIRVDSRQFYRVQQWSDDARHGIQVLYCHI